MGRFPEDFQKWWDALATEVDGAAAAVAPAPSIRPLDALFSTTQQRVLALLFGQPDASFHACELIARTGSGSGAVQRELARLQASGLVTARVRGKRKL